MRGIYIIRGNVLSNAKNLTKYYRTLALFRKVRVKKKKEGFTLQKNPTVTGKSAVTSSRERREPGQIKG